jgi:hypothetical protein
MKLRNTLISDWSQRAEEPFHFTFDSRSIIRFESQLRRVLSMPYIPSQIA